MQTSWIPAESSRQSLFQLEKTPRPSSFGKHGRNCAACQRETRLRDIQNPEMDAKAMTLTKRGLKNYMMGRALSAKMQSGKPSLPEKQFNEYQIARGMGLVWCMWDYKVPFIKPDTREVIRFQCDFLRPTDAFYDENFEVDGQKWHSSPAQIANDNWKDRIKNANGVRVFHIPAIICPRQHWSYLDKEITKARASPQTVARIAG